MVFSGAHLKISDLHFAGKEIKAQQGQMVCPMSSSYEAAALGLKQSSVLGSHLSPSGLAGRIGLSFPNSAPEYQHGLSSKLNGPCQGL